MTTTMQVAFGYGGDHPVPVRPKAEGVPAEAYLNPGSNYVFEPVMVRKMLRFLLGSPARKNLLLTGEPGVGKTSFVNEVAARLGVPVFALSCSGRIRLDHMVGGFEFVGGNTRWRDGPLVAAMRSGGIFLANEITRLDPGEQMALAEVLDAGARITIPDTGEVVVADERFRFVATGNSGTHGDGSDAYPGERASSVAFRDRFVVWEIPHLEAQAELALLEREIGGALPTEVLSAAVSFANEVRESFVGRGGRLRTIVSTRSLVVWMKEAAAYSAMPGIEKPVLEALRDVVLNGAPAEEKMAVEAIWNNWVN